MDLHFTSELWYWRGPSPYHFVTVPDQQGAAIADVQALVTYGWGMIPVTVRIGSTEFPTSLWPKDGGFIVPVKKAVRDAERLELGEGVDVSLRLDIRLAP